MGTTRSIDAKYCVPTGVLYPGDCPWDLKVLKKHIIDKKLAPILPGAETEDQTLAPPKGLGERGAPPLPPEECPICNLWYRSLNKVRCCREYLCTECYIQIVKKPGDTAVKCPFCSVVGFSASYAGCRPAEERIQERHDSELYLAARQRQKGEEEEERKQRQLEEERTRLQLEEQMKAEVKARTEAVDQLHVQTANDPAQEGEPVGAVEIAAVGGPNHGGFDWDEENIDPAEQAMILQALQLSMLEAEGQ